MNNNDTITLPVEQNIKIPKGYKKTTIGIIPVEWEVKKIKEIGYVSSGGTPDTTTLDYWGGDINWCTPTDITALSDKFLGATKAKITEKGLKNSSAKLLPPFSIIVCTRATIGKVAMNTVPMSTNQGFKNIIPKNIDTDFLYYKILSEDKGLIKIANGSTFLEVSKTDFDNYSISIPPQQEQQKIAEILSTWDEAITNCKTIINTLKSRNKGLAQQLLTGKKRLSGFSEKWTNTHLGKIATRITTKNEELNDTVVTISAQRGFVLQEDFFNKRVASNTLSGYYLLKKGQFAYNKSYSNGYPMGAFKRLNDFEKAVVTTLYICFELKQNICPDYMVYFFENGLMTNNLMKVAKEGGRAHGLLNIGLDDFLNLELKMPPFNEQTAISQVLETANQELKSYEEKLKALQLQKKGLMQQLLTGKLRVNVN